MESQELGSRAYAQRDFSRARMRAFWEEMRSLVTGKPNELLRFEDVQRRLRLRGQRNLGLQDVPLDQIVGTVGRYHDFTRSFLPRKTVNQHRWSTILAMARGSVGLPPIELYKVGDAYFVIDGNHRVSVARQLEQPTIEAYVIEIPTSIPFDENTTPDELDEKQAYAEFLTQTRLDGLRSGSNLLLTEPGWYGQIIHHIEVHRYFLGLEQDREIPWSEAVTSWYDNVYMPMIEVIRKHDLLREFPNRTEADLYVWLMRHRSALHEHYGQEVWPSAEETAQDFIDKIQP